MATGSMLSVGGSFTVPNSDSVLVAPRQTMLPGDIVDSLRVYSGPDGFANTGTPNRLALSLYLHTRPPADFGAAATGGQSVFESVEFVLVGRGTGASGTFFYADFHIPLGIVARAPFLYLALVLRDSTVSGLQQIGSAWFDIYRPGVSRP